MAHKFFVYLENVLTPVAVKVGGQRHLTAVRDGFICAMPFIIVGSFMLIFAFPPFPEDTTFIIGRWWIEAANKYAYEIMTPFNMTMGIMAVFISVGVAYNLAKSYKMEGLPCALLSLMSFFLIAAPARDGVLPGDYLGGTGVFTAVVLAIYVTELMRFLKVKNIGIPLPDSVPQNIRQSFNLLIPAVVVIMTIYLFNLFLVSSFEMVLPQAIMNIFKPLISASDTLPALLFAALLAQLLWFCGIHGATIVSGIMSPFYLINLSANQAALEAGLPLPHIIAGDLWTYIISCGGSGATFGLVLLYLRSKSSHLKAIGKLSVVPGLFNINEPVIFGSPVVMNPLLFIPFILVPMVNATIGYLLLSANWLDRIITMVPWTVPAPIGFAWAAGWKMNNALLVLALVVVDLIIYYPFFKMHERHLLQQEAEAGQE
ncbi:PTS sugar transporter subunit IIC [Affinibrenneria salicis]|uniref:Permease IIC component n=1 Tax=Affinibrenneria salicis TaxID=2590031 RepID=A0A5J5G2X9_9GAMM|nr:PTS sugar transporter subunit IIC [Affinibrenneria salicis]KAA9001255.1 PTS sugar transporter subunit IIC [Affinibrenneria salicis]